ncbi:hypothetical protein NDN01_24425 [Sphingomonas sp. QA11]|uniref:hypothetical protein n=1 Tax=Sphingomonas sp. QA11 TaxID=2950605 RepID=UPI00234AD5CC|nr:hypothetical protein [Sphingomonas sp. QA11]WCM27088.1 hypothetical protein NDN01_24425 [Sphingomonas sp. QA11]
MAIVTPKGRFDRADVRAALAGGLAFLERVQLDSGEFRVVTSLRRDMTGDCEPDPSIFPTALIAHCLSFAPAANLMRDRGLAFLLAQRDRHGLWRHWTRDHPFFRQLPPDMDDTCCVSAALATAGSTDGADPALLLANRDAQGMFLTWIMPRARWMGRAHMRVTLPQLRHLVTLWFFFKKTSAAPADVDAGVNANCLHYLGSFPGDARVVERLVGILRRGGEPDADKWYENPFVLWYFFARALGDRSEEARGLLLARLDAAPPTSALEIALSIAARLYCGAMPPDELIDALLARQSSDGSWPRAPVYFGGRERRRDGSLAPAHPDTPHWGSEELTTGFCIEALARVSRTEAA